MQALAHKEADDDTIVHGVKLPHRVILAFKKIQLNPSNCTAGELKEAVRHAEDGQMIEDENGVSFLDKLVKTFAEKRKSEEAKDGLCEEDDRESHHWRNACGKGKCHHTSHVESIKAERIHNAGLHEHCNA